MTQNEFDNLFVRSEHNIFTNPQLKMLYEKVLLNYESNNVSKFKSANIAWKIFTVPLKENNIFLEYNIKKTKECICEKWQQVGNRSYKD